MSTRPASARVELHQRSQEFVRRTTSGYPMVALAIVLGLGAFLCFLATAASGGLSALLAVLLAAATAFVLRGLYMLQPNEGALLILFGAYRGTDRVSGLRWSNPFYRKLKVSLRAHNLASERVKVNDKRGNPIEIAAAIVWRVQDTAQARFDVEDYTTYVRIQAEAAIRHLATRYAYDDGDDLEAGETTLRAGQDKVAASLAREVQERVDPAGIVIEDAKLTHLAYASEIAQVMLRRQQAEAIISARTKIVQGAVGMVELALQALSERDIVHLDDERKAAMVSNLLVVLCSESETQPVVNAGTLYP